MDFTRITIDPSKMGGVPCVRGMTEEEILGAYPDLEPEDIRESLRYAAHPVNVRGVFQNRASLPDQMISS